MQEQIRNMTTICAGSTVDSFREVLAGNRTAIIKAKAEGDAVLEFARSVASGLTSSPRSLECRYLYDAHGSALFDLITEQPEYYLTRAESEILAANACRIRDITGPVTLLELGSGSSAKTDHLLRAWLACTLSVRYVPVDVSESALREACQHIADVHFAAQVIGVNAEYQDAFPIVRETSPVMVLFLGSTIGNFSPEDERRFFADLASSLSAGDFLLVGVDLVKDRAVIEPAYNDAAGVTADFTRNLFARMNRELGSYIDLSAVEHLASYNAELDQVDIRARFTRGQEVCVEPLGESFAVAAGDVIHTEISRKYRLDKFIPHVESLGFDAEEVFTDERDWFALVLLRRRGSQSGRM